MPTDARSWLAGTVGTVAAWYAGFTLLPQLVGTCFDGACERGGREIAATFGVALVFLAVPIALEVGLYRRTVGAALTAIGLTRLDGAGARLAALYLLPLVAFHPLYGWLTGAWPALRPGWGWLAAAALVNNGLVEEAMMRDFVFRHLRERWPFWTAAALTTACFAGYHLPLIASAGPLVGTVGVILAVPTGFLTAWLYERGRNTLTGPALMHAGNNGLAFVFVYPEAAQPLASAGYIALGATVATAMVVGAYRSGFARTPSR